jgi:putative phosphoesterase
MLIGVISDTHGLLRPEAVEALAGSDLILHAGDVGEAGILEKLAKIAPVIAVRGNVDSGAWSARLRDRERIECQGALLYMLHDVNMLDLDPAAAGIHAVISGHSHKPVLQKRDGVLYLNPGSAGPRRFKLPVALARLRIEDSKLAAEQVLLQS